MLVNRTLGKSLDKTFQVSDWERRPLRTEQLHYAGKLFLYQEISYKKRKLYFPPLDSESAIWRSETPNVFHMQF